jgi:aspartate/methionine/tyrosine aminotransferase
MRFEPFLLDQWIERKFDPRWSIECDLTSSAGPSWTLGQLMSMEGREDHAGLKNLQELLDTALVYSMAPGMPALRHAIGEAEGVVADDVLVVTGAQEALLAIFCAIAEPGANVVVPHPGYPPFSELPRALGLEVRRYYLRVENRFRIEPSEILQLADQRTKLVLINSPHNPTGVVLTMADRTQVHDHCADRKIQCVCDQVFHPIYHGEPEPTMATLPGATVVGDLSKALSLSGLRIGWIVEHDAERRAAYERLRSYFTVTNSPLCERLAVIALQHRERILERARQNAMANLEYLERQFTSVLSGLVEWVRPLGGFTAFPRMRDGHDTRPLCEYLASRGVLIVPGDCFGMPSHFRIGLGDERDRFRRALERLCAELEVYALINEMRPYAKGHVRSALLAKRTTTQELGTTRDAVVETVVRRLDLSQKQAAEAYTLAEQHETNPPVEQAVRNRCHCDDPGLAGALIGGSIGAIVGGVVGTSWENSKEYARRQHLRVKEKAFTRRRDALAAERRRMPWLAVEALDEFDSRNGTVLDLFEWRQRLFIARSSRRPSTDGPTTESRLQRSLIRCAARPSDSAAPLGEQAPNTRPRRRLPAMPLSPQRLLARAGSRRTTTIR